MNHLLNKHPQYPYYGQLKDNAVQGPVGCNGGESWAAGFLDETHDIRTRRSKLAESGFGPRFLFHFAQDRGAKHWVFSFQANSVQKKVDRNLSFFWPKTLVDSWNITGKAVFGK